MGSDLHMDPPRSFYRGEWQGDEWVIFHKSGWSASGDEPWKEIWRGDDEQIQKNVRILPLRPSPKPGSDENVIEMLQTKFGHHVDHGVRFCRDIVRRWNSVKAGHLATALVREFAKEIFQDVPAKCIVVMDQDIESVREDVRCATHGGQPGHTCHEGCDIYTVTILTYRQER